jgi:hypothetical protein
MPVLRQPLFIWRQQLSEFSESSTAETEADACEETSQMGRVGDLSHNARQAEKKKQQ